LQAKTLSAEAAGPKKDLFSLPCRERFCLDKYLSFR